MFTGRQQETSVDGELGRSVLSNLTEKWKTEEHELMIDSG